MISSIKVASIKPGVSEYFRCRLISLRLSDSDKKLSHSSHDSCSALFLFRLFLSPLRCIIVQKNATLKILLLEAARSGAGC